ncbi:MAG: sulfatase/phosphatase domain-containing protein [Ignavibacteriaceae bacterium]
MKRREFIKDVALTTAGIALSPMIFDACSNPHKRMNILFIMSDDHAYQAISSYGSKLNVTPNIDKLAKEGMMFEDSFVTNAICGPSRACILTGKYNHINGMIDNGTTFDGSQETFIKLLRKSGYRTAIVGKWHLKSQPEGFDYWNILPGQGEYYNPDFIEMGKKKRVDGYVTDLITDFAINWLDRRDKSEPFCLMLHNKGPHRNWMPDEKHFDMYDNKELPLPETFFDDYKTRSDAAREQKMEVARDLNLDYDLKIPLDKKERQKFKDEKFDENSWKASYDRMSDEQKADWNKEYNSKKEKFEESSLHGKELAEWKYERYIKDYLECIASVDDNVGRVLNYLKKNNLDDNTIVVYTSDQGFYLGEHGWFDKRWMYEQSLRTPLIVKVPGVTRGTVDYNDMVLNIDYAPTFLDYAGVDIPGDMQGESFRKILEGHHPKNWRTAVYYHYFEYPAVHSVKRHYGIRTARYKLIHFYYDIDAWELYDLQNDPNELNNLYDNPEYKPVIKDLKIQLQKLREQYKDTDEKKFLPKKNIKINHKGIGAKVAFVYPYASKYSGGNPNALFDGWIGPDKMYSNVDYSVYQGFEKNDMIANVDLGKELDMHEIKIGFLQHTESWIFLPEWVEIQYSDDKKNFTSLGKINRKSSLKSTYIFKEYFDFRSEPIKARYLKIHAKNIGTCPPWHSGAGGRAWIFTDEVIVT